MKVSLKKGASLRKGVKLAGKSPKKASVPAGKNYRYYAKSKSKYKLA